MMFWGVFFFKFSGFVFFLVVFFGLVAFWALTIIGPFGDHVFLGGHPRCASR